MNSFVALCLIALAGTQQALATITLARYSTFLATCPSDPISTTYAIPGECAGFSTSGAASTSVSIGCGSVSVYATDDCTGAANSVGLSSTCSAQSPITGGCETFSEGEVLAFTTYTDADCTTATGLSTVFVNGQCIAGIKYLVSGNNLTIQTFGLLDFSCGGTPATSTSIELESGSKCTASGGGGSVGYTQVAAGTGAQAPCFHEDTTITYQGEELTLAQLKDHDQCTIPHTIKTHGVVIEAECNSGSSKTLRLTNGHLVYTAEGLLAASEVTEGSTVFADVAETEACKVVSNKPETSKQNYFGLNCYNSVVLADGLKTSTFELMHEVPSMWMSTVGNMFGIKYASVVGEKLANFFVPFLQ